MTSPCEPKWPSCEYWQKKAVADEAHFYRQAGWKMTPQYVQGVPQPVEEIDPEKARDRERGKLRGYW